MLFSLVQVFGVKCSPYFCGHLTSNPISVHSDNPQAQEVMRASLRVWGTAPQVVSIWWMITWSQTAFVPWGYFHSWPSAELPTTETLKDTHPRAAIFTENLSCFGAVLFLLRIKFLLSITPVEIWDTDLYPTCPLLLNSLLYASSHLMAIFHQAEDQNPLLLLIPCTSPVFGGLNF